MVIVVWNQIFNDSIIYNSKNTKAQRLYIEHAMKTVLESKHSSNIEDKSTNKLLPTFYRISKILTSHIYRHLYVYTCACMILYMYAYHNCYSTYYK